MGDPGCDYPGSKGVIDCEELGDLFSFFTSFGNLYLYNGAFRNWWYMMPGRFRLGFPCLTSFLSETVPAPHSMRPWLDFTCPPLGGPVRMAG